jgi:hypothetical protein
MNSAALSRRIVAILLAGVAAAARTAAVSHPDFSGAWTLVDEHVTRADGAHDPLAMFTFGKNVTIRQDEKTLTIAVWTVPLDGSVVRDGDGATREAHWSGDTLVLTESEPSPGSGKPSVHTCILSFDNERHLVIEITSTPVLDVKWVRSTYAHAALPARAVPPPHVSLAGRWHIDGAASDLGGTGVGWFGNDATVTEDATSVTFASIGSGVGSGAITFKLDGRDDQRATPRGHIVTKAAWSGDRLVIVETSYIEAVDPRSQREVQTTSERTITVSLDRDGALVVDVAVSGAGAAAAHFAAHSVYRKGGSRPVGLPRQAPSSAW